MNSLDLDCIGKKHDNTAQNSNLWSKQLDERIANVLKDLMGKESEDGQGQMSYPERHGELALFAGEELTGILEPISEPVAENDVAHEQDEEETITVTLQITVGYLQKKLVANVVHL